MYHRDPESPQLWMLYPQCRPNCLDRMEAVRIQMVVTWELKNITNKVAVVFFIVFFMHAFIYHSFINKNAKLSG